MQTATKEWEAPGMSSSKDKQSNYFSSIVNLEQPTRRNSDFPFEDSSISENSIILDSSFEPSTPTPPNSNLSPLKSLRPLITHTNQLSPIKSSYRYFSSSNSITSSPNKSYSENHELPPLPKENNEYTHDDIDNITINTINNHSPTRSSLLDYDSDTSFFKQTMYSPQTPQTPRSPRSPFSPFSPIKLTSKKSIPLPMEILINSRSDKTHNLEVFENQTYVDFWNLSNDEGNLFKKWNKSEFEVQSLIFEVFNNLKKISFNLHRFIFVYAENIKALKIISVDTYKNTFDVLSQFYYFLEKLLYKKLKPLFDNQFLVDDYQILKILLNFFKQLKTQYRTISGAMVYISKLFLDENFRNLVIDISSKDFELSNRSAVSATELFNSYFIKLFTSIQLLFNRLKSCYEEYKKPKNEEISSNLESLIKEINYISDNTSDLDKKISFNEKLSYKTEIDFSRTEMIDMFNNSRKSKEPIQFELKLNHIWVNALLAPFDNYLLILTIKNGILKNKDEYNLSKPPIPIQYLKFDTIIDGNYKILNIRNLNNNSVYQFRKINDITIKIFDRFLKDLEVAQSEFWNSDINNLIDLKLFHYNSFISKSNDRIQFNLKPIENNNIIHNLINDIDTDMNTENLITNEVLSCDYFTYNSEKFCIFGTLLGIYLSKITNNLTNKVYKVHQIPNIRKITVLDNSIILFFGGSNNSLYKLSIEKIYHKINFNLPPCDINIFDENFPNIKDFTVGYQIVNNNNLPFLFVWNNKQVWYTELIKPSYKFNFKNFKTLNNVIKLQTVYANNFAISNVIDNNANWEISKIQDLRSKKLNNLNIKDILKNERPISIYPFPNKTNKISEILVIYSSFAVRMKNVNSKYIQSKDEILWFGIECEDSSFDCEDKNLIVVGKRAVEVWSIFEDFSVKSKLIGCFIGESIKLINEMPGKAIIKLHELDNKGAEYKKEIIFKIRRMKRKKTKK